MLNLVDFFKTTYYFMRLKLAINPKKRVKYRIKYYNKYLKHSNDTTLKEINEVLQRKIKDIQKHKRKVKVAFLCHDYTQWNLQSVYDAMEKDGSFELQIRVMKMTHNNSQEIYDIFKSKGANVCWADEVEFDYPDVLFYHVHYFNEKFYNILMQYKNCLCIDCGYGFFTSAINKAFAEDKSLKYLWKRFVPTELEKKRAEKYVKNEIIISGKAKMDVLYDGHKLENFWKSDKTKHIVYAPHYAINCHQNSGNFDKYYLKFYDYLKNHPEVEILLKPHPVLRARMCDTKAFNDENIKDIVTPEEYDNFIENWKKLPNGSYYDGNNYYDVFLTSDAMILDCWSFMAEYMSTKKPMLYCSKVKDYSTLYERFNELGKNLISAMDIAYEWEDIEKFIENCVIKNEDKHIKDREYVANRYLLVNKGHVGEFIKDNIKKDLKIV